MELHLFKFSRRKLAGLIENVFWHGELSHVVEKRRGFDRANLTIISYSDTLRETDCILLNSSNVAMGDLIFCIDCHRQSFNSREIESIQLAKMAIGIIDAPKRSLEGQIRD